VLARRLATARFAVTCHREGWRHLQRIARPGDAAKVLCVAHGIDTRVFRRREGGTRPGLLLAVGRLTPKKGFDTLIDACGLLRERGHAFRCEIIGEGRLRGALQERIRARGVADQVRIRSFRAQEELPRWYRRAAVFVAPAVCTPDGNRDGLPNVVLEAMAAGLATLELVQQPGFHEQLDATAKKLLEGLQERAHAAGIPFTSNQVGGMFGLFFSDAETVNCFSDVNACDLARFQKFFHAMLEEGVYLAPSAFEAGFVSSAHDDIAIQATLDASERAFATLA